MNKQDLLKLIEETSEKNLKENSLLFTTEIFTKDDIVDIALFKTYKTGIDEHTMLLNYFYYRYRRRLIGPPFYLHNPSTTWGDYIQACIDDFYDEYIVINDFAENLKYMLFDMRKEHSNIIKSILNSDTYIKTTIFMQASIDERIAVIEEKSFYIVYDYLMHA